eukprot:Blabericola_migrator_1__12942@NODE_854_length_6247_cov_104_237702_g605_i0_p1_GENE_NODE_854_length_6247_cov_104_237702_g605_i0NODE_854_length_6247_cov_104_237702_g605_i0_p1_ORF_typecomplete_len936_score150_95GRIP/PF01465_20/0_00016Phage_HK97_TLTM/PF06120_11/0_041Phage_HK97_TLTM/PF06120_11/0_15UPF0242/PF06785_11/0_42UPF0242/PF06785_11/0_0005EzrA/PF06160_12/0_0015EzrA/PF06160_12/51Syntaxin/PF00804_25/0_7Syntaxin/PF00804_25/0_14DUF4407/PF14362_6/1_5DUF4407/PF14362_6/0_0078TSC22/PF01166_18/1_9e03TSC2
MLEESAENESFTETKGREGLSDVIVTDEAVSESPIKTLSMPKEAKAPVNAGQATGNPQLAPVTQSLLSDLLDLTADSVLTLQQQQSDPYPPPPPSDPAKPDIEGSAIESSGWEEPNVLVDTPEPPLAPPPRKESSSQKTASSITQEIDFHAVRPNSGPSKPCDWSDEEEKERQRPSVLFTGTLLERDTWLQRAEAKDQQRRSDALDVTLDVSKRADRLSQSDKMESPAPVFAALSSVQSSCDWEASAMQKPISVSSPEELTSGTSHPQTSNLAQSSDSRTAESKFTQSGSFADTKTYDSSLFQLGERDRLSSFLGPLQVPEVGDSTATVSFTGEPDIGSPVNSPRRFLRARVTSSMFEIPPAADQCVPLIMTLPSSQSPERIVEEPANLSIDATPQHPRSRTPEGQAPAAMLAADVRRNITRYEAWHNVVSRLLSEGHESLPAEFYEYEASNTTPVQPGPISDVTSNAELDILARQVVRVRSNCDALGTNDDKVVMSISDHLDELVKYRSKFSPDVYAKSKVLRIGRLEYLTQLSKQKFGQQTQEIDHLKNEIATINELLGAESVKSAELDTRLKRVTEKLEEATRTNKNLESKLADARPNYNDTNKWEVSRGFLWNERRLVELRSSQHDGVIIDCDLLEPSRLTDVKYDHVILRQGEYESLRLKNLSLVTELAKTVQAQPVTTATPIGVSVNCDPEASMVMQSKLAEQRERLTAEFKESINELKDHIAQLQAENTALNNRLRSTTKVSRSKSNTLDKSSQDFMRSNESTGSDAAQQLVAMLQERLRQKDTVIDSLSRQIATLEDSAIESLQVVRPMDDVASPDSTLPVSASEVLSPNRPEDLLLLQAKYDQLKQRYLELQSLTGPESASKEQAHQRIFLKNALIKFMQSDPVGSPEHEGLLPVIMRLLGLTAKEIREIESRRPASRKLKLPFFE